MRDDQILLYSDRHGIYIPQIFADDIRREKVTGVSESDYRILIGGPDGPSEWYWETWEQVLNNAILTDDKGKQYRLYQDGDLWAIPVDWVEDDWNNFTGEVY